MTYIISGGHADLLGAEDPLVHGAACINIYIYTYVCMYVYIYIYTCVEG